MDDKFRINFRVPKEFQILVKSKIGERKDSEFMLEVLDKFFNPEIHYVDREVEIIKTIEKEVIREVVIDNEGTVQGHSVSLSDALFAELSKLKYNPDTSMDAFVGDILWNRIHWSQNKKSSATTQKNGTTQEAQTEQPKSSPMFEEFRQLKVDCETPEDWKELIQVIKESSLTEKQKGLLINTSFR